MSLVDRILETARWCATRADPNDPLWSLRSPELRPPRIAYIPRNDSYPPSFRSNELWFGAPADDPIDAILEQLARMRRDLLAHRSAARPAGRLLVYEPGANLADGAAARESSGFFDVDNAPPWDTWIAAVHTNGDPRRGDYYLLAWVPAALDPHAQRGIEVNPEACIRSSRRFDYARACRLEAVLARYGLPCD
ncbi:hypothetical protein [Pendulispora albinea]|uniref:RES domain-containing protein n=1 Tax=Pendulispora albinea TaxID=2741071 RepID=A0ABZ2MBU9_9BACT